MRFDLVNTKELRLVPGSATSLLPVLGLGPQGLPGPGAAAWTALQAVTTGSVRQAPDGSWIKSLGNRTTRASFDATEQGFWVAVLASAGTVEEAALAGRFAPLGAVVAVGDTAAQIQTKADLCATDGTTLGIPGGTWTLGATGVVFHCSVMADPSAIFTGNASPVVKVGNGTSILSWATLHLPQVTRQTKNWGASGTLGTGVIGTDIGVLVDDTRTCRITVPRIANFSYGLKFADDAGALYNTVFLGHLDNNALNLYATTAGVGGAANECQVIGGRYSHNSGEGTDVTGTRHIALISGAAGPPNNWLFLGGSVEGSVPEFHLECAGHYNMFKSLRWEATPARAKFTGSAAYSNKIDGGYGADSIVLTNVSSAAKNEIDAAGAAYRGTRGGVDGSIILSNGSSTGYPILLGLPITEDPFGTGGSAPSVKYGVAVAASGIKGKVAADTEARVELDFINGRVGLGSGGSTAISKWLREGASAGTMEFVACGPAPATDATYDVGVSTTVRRFRNAFFSGDIKISDGGGVVKTGSGATGSRPGAGAAGAGALWYDTTLARHISTDAATAWYVIPASFFGTATLDFPSIAAGGSQELTLTVTGAVTGDTVSLGAPAAIEAGLVWNGFVSAANTVKVRVSNITGSAIDPASATWKASIVR